jgi:membrane protein
MLIRNIPAIFKDTVNDWLEDKVPRMGAALAYYSVFSVAPLLLIAIAIAGIFFGEQAAKSQLRDQISEAVGSSAAAAVEEILGSVHRGGTGLLGSLIGLVILLFGASGVFIELQDALNSIWKVKPKPGRSGVWAFIRDRLFSFLVVLGTGFLLLASLIVTAVLAGVENALRDQLTGIGWFWWSINLIVTFGLITLLFAMIYKVLPDTTVGWRDVWVGAVLAALFFSLGKYLIGLYVSRGGVASAFGAAGSVIVLLTWVYYSSQILLFGAEFTRVYSRYAGSDIRPSPHAMAVSATE